MSVCLCVRVRLVRLSHLQSTEIGFSLIAIWLDGWMDGSVDGWMDGRMEGSIND